MHISTITPRLLPLRAFRRKRPKAASWRPRGYGYCPARPRVFDCHGSTKSTGAQSCGGDQVEPATSYLNGEACHSSNGNGKRRLPSSGISRQSRNATVCSKSMSAALLLVVLEVVCQSAMWLSGCSLRHRGPCNGTTDIQAVFVSHLAWRGVVFYIRTQLGFKTAKSTDASRSDPFSEPPPWVSSPALSHPEAGCKGNDATALSFCSFGQAS